MKKFIYTIIGCFSGEDFSTDDPVVYEAHTNLDKACQAFNDIVADTIDGFSDNCDYSDPEVYGDGTIVFEYTDFDNDEHGIIKLVKTELK